MSYAMSYFIDVRHEIASQIDFIIKSVTILSCHVLLNIIISFKCRVTYLRPKRILFVSLLHKCCFSKNKLKGIGSVTSCRKYEAI